MLSRDDNGVDAFWNTCVAILDRHLTLGVGPEISHQLTFLADFSQGMNEEMRQVQ